MLLVQIQVFDTVFYTRMMTSAKSTSQQFTFNLYNSVLFSSSSLCIWYMIKVKRLGLYITEVCSIFGASLKKWYSDLLYILLCLHYRLR